MYVHVMVQCNLHLLSNSLRGPASAASEPSDLIAIKPPHGLALAVSISHTVFVVPASGPASVSHVQLGRQKMRPSPPTPNRPGPSR